MQFLGLMAGLFGLDILLKGKIEAGDKEDFPRDMERTSGKIRLYRNHNDGFCFGLLKNNQELVKTVPLVFTSAVTGVFFWLLTRKSRLIDKLGFSLVTAGALSNLFDRVKRGYVVDYFSFQFGWLKKVYSISAIFVSFLVLFCWLFPSFSPARRAGPEESRNTGQIKRMELWSSNT